MGMDLTGNTGASFVGPDWFVKASVRCFVWRAVAQ